MIHAHEPNSVDWMSILNSEKDNSIQIGGN